MQHFIRVHVRESQAAGTCESPLREGGRRRLNAVDVKLAPAPRRRRASATRHFELSPVNRRSLDALVRTASSCTLSTLVSLSKPDNNWREIERFLPANCSPSISLIFFFRRRY